MDMTIEKSLQRLQWRFKQGKAYKPNENDIAAYNRLVDYVNDTKRSYVVDNILFTKLYIFCYGEFLRHYEATVHDKIPQSELNRILAMGVNEIIERFRTTANLEQLKKVERPEDMEKHNDLTFDECVSQLKEMTFEAINAYSHKHLNRI
ncbi:MAG TPA: hypothetical protein VFM69_06480 [Pricia sp.]|nr:hypothetical protein [Pricia sp.]